MPKVLSLAVNQFAPNPSAPTITNVGTPGAAARSYAVVARVTYADGTTQSTAVSANGSTATGNASPNGTNFDRVTWAALAAIAGATIAYDVYRTVGGTSQGKIGTTSGTSFDDAGLVADGSTAPSTNVTGIGAKVDTSLLEKLTFQLSNGGTTPDFVATVLIEGSQDGVEFVTLATLSNAARSGLASGQYWASVRAHMTAYASGISTLKAYCGGH